MKSTQNNNEKKPVSRRKAAKGYAGPLSPVTRGTGEIPVRSTTLREKFNGWRLGFSVDKELLFKILVVAVILVFLVIVQTTVFSVFHPLGCVPDLMLPFVIVVATLEKERFGSVTALCAAYIIEAAGGTEVTLLPLLYVAVAYVIGILSTHSFRDSFPVAVMYTSIAMVLRGIVSFIVAMITVDGIGVVNTLCDIVLPEFLVNMVFAIFTELFVRLCLLPFRKKREEKIAGVK
ncbi:MAG: hypothetical protein IKW68_03930 [Clostridia bacterium]|nr:hypothetical protein [Clostridia bacterium]